MLLDVLYVFQYIFPSRPYHTNVRIYSRFYKIFQPYDNHQISAVDMTKEDLNTKNLICYEVITGEHIQMQN